jgi:outer membrane protein TolC
MHRVIVLLSFLAAGCAGDESQPQGTRPNVAAATQPSAEALRLDSSQISPMYRETLAIDLPTVAQVASLKNIDILEARQAVEASRGQYESAFGAIFPVIAPGAVLDHLQGVNRSDIGQVVAVNFTTFQPALLVQLFLNPGRVYYEVVASKKRLLATQQQERFVIMETIRSAVVQYYDLILAQTRVSVAREAVTEAEELLRLTRLRLRAGTGLPADELRALASLAGRQQDLVLALNGFYEASITLASTLYLDASVTLVPKPEQIAPTRLVREDLGIDEMLTIAMQWRPDLESVKNFAAATTADTNATIWGAAAPQLQAGYQFGGLSSQTPGQNFPLQKQEHASASAIWTLSPSIFGQVKTASAVEQQAALEAERRLEDVRALVLRAAQESTTNAQIIPIAKQQVDAADEALRLARQNLQAGTALTIDVLQAEDAVNEARLRYASAVTNYNQSRTNLLAALGLIDSVTISASGAAASPTIP